MTFQFYGHIRTLEFDLYGNDKVTHLKLASAKLRNTASALRERDRIKAREKLRRVELYHYSRQEHDTPT